MKWLDNFFRAKKTPLPTPWQQDPFESRRLSRQASWSELQAREFIRKGPPEFKPVVMTFQGAKEVEPRQPAHSADGKCPKCGDHRIQRLCGSDKRCAMCGEQWEAM